MPQPTPATNPEKLNRTLERAKQELEHMLDLNPQGMLLVNKTGVVVRANRALLELVGLPDFSDVLSHSLEQLFPIQDPSIFKRLLEGATGYETSEVLTSLRDSSSRTLRFTAVNSEDHTDLSVLIVQDITGEKEEARHLEKKYKKEAVVAVVGALMHVINQPLTVILVRSHLMQLALEHENPPLPELKKNLQDVVNLVMKVADTLKLLETPKDFVTQKYMDGVDILDIKRSGGRAGRWKSICTTAMDPILALLDIHEPGASSHSRRTAEFAVQLAQRMGVEEERVEVLRLSAAYHDIGKIGIPDYILQKPTALDDEERGIIRRHPEMGHGIVKSFPSMTEEAEIILAHHERFDGQGYPRGLSQQEIPLLSRIITVADTFDALRFQRYYHDPSPLEKTVEEIKNGSGTQFDPQVVQVFYTCYRDLDAIFPHNEPVIPGVG